jgi:hypothetical protein
VVLSAKSVMSPSISTQRMVTAPKSATESAVAMIGPRREGAAFELVVAVDIEGTRDRAIAPNWPRRVLSPYRVQV